MPEPRLQIPIELLELNPKLSKAELRAVIMTIWKSKNNKIRQSRIFRIVIPHLGVLRSHGNKKPKYKKGVLKRDKKRKRELYRKQAFSVNSLLF